MRTYQRFTKEQRKIILTFAREWCSKTKFYYGITRDLCSELNKNSFVNAQGQPWTTQSVGTFFAHYNLKKYCIKRNSKHRVSNVKVATTPVKNRVPNLNVSLNKDENELLQLVIASKMSDNKKINAIRAIVS